MTEICSTTQDLILLALAWLELKRIVVGEVARGNGRAQPADPWLVSLEEQRNDESTVPNAANRDLIVLIFILPLITTHLIGKKIVGFCKEKNKNKARYKWHAPARVEKHGRVLHQAKQNQMHALSRAEEHARAR
ncbi:hypothetical protein JCGZ_08425 [Jatropha curcas]|uniref:Uncharacterized protein n=1 Tax=Jatropha curcas TaxID=180498 RepID=A0A067KXN7_JATCU|nr:hypothetical protein JCGZ_08425 [Jatropha curcas]